MSDHSESATAGVDLGQVGVERGKGDEELSFVNSVLDRLTGNERERFRAALRTEDGETSVFFSWNRDNAAMHDKQRASPELVQAVFAELRSNGYEVEPGGGRAPVAKIRKKLT